MTEPLNLSAILSRLDGAPVAPQVFDAIDSTNAELARQAANGAPEGTLLVTATQDAGRGTRGRSFASPVGGVYFSLLLRPNVIDGAFVSAITPAIAVAASRAIDGIFGVETGIKWVNDLYLNAKKIAGLLAESTSGAVVCGIGVNIVLPDDDAFAGLPNAGAITRSPPEFAREFVAADTARNLLALYKNLASRDFLDEYRARSVVIGCDVTVIRSGETYGAKALEIDGDFRLVVKKQDGSIEKLSFGEVSVKL